MTADAPPFYTPPVEAAVEEALVQTAWLGQRAFVERLWGLGFEIRKRGGKR